MVKFSVCLNRRGFVMYIKYENLKSTEPVNEHGQITHMSWRIAITEKVDCLLFLLFVFFCCFFYLFIYFFFFFFFFSKSLIIGVSAYLYTVDFSSNSCVYKTTRLILHKKMKSVHAWAEVVSDPNRPWKLTKWCYLWPILVLTIKSKYSWHQKYCRYSKVLCVFYP